MNELYETFRSAILTGFGFMHVEAGDVYLLLGAIAGFSIIVGFLISPKEANVAQPLAWGVMAIALAIFIDFFGTFAEGFADGMWLLGSSATGGASVSSFRDFDGLLLSGYEMAMPIISSLHGWSWWEIATGLEDWIWGWIAIGVLILTNAYLAFRLFILMLSYLVMSLVAMVALPAMVWNQTAFLAQGALRFIVGTGLSILAFGVVLSVVWGVASGIEFLADMTRGDTLMNVAKCIVGFFLALRTQSMTQGYFSGGMPNTGSGIGSTLRSGLYSMHAAQSLMHAARAVSHRVNGTGSQGPSTSNNAPSTNPGIYGSGSTGGSSNNYGGAWRQPNSRTGTNP